MKAIEIKGLEKTFTSNFLLKKYKVLKDINISIEKGEIYGFLGPNGAGKTTTIKCMLGLISFDSGESLIYGKDSKSIEGREKIGFLPEHPYFYDYLTAKELLIFSGMLFSIPIKKVMNKAKYLLELVGLEGKEDLKLKKFSKGMIQRLGFAQTLINDPEIIILDEPFSGLDPIGRKELRDLIISLKKSGKTIFFSSHILQDMEMIVDTVGIILEGKTIKQGKLSDLISHSVQYHEVVFRGVDESLLKSNNIGFELKDNNYITKSKDFEKVNHIIEFIIMNHGKIISVTPFKMTLEDIFLEEINR